MRPEDFFKVEDQEKDDLFPEWHYRVVMRNEDLHTKYVKGEMLYSDLCEKIAVECNVDYQELMDYVNALFAECELYSYLIGSVWSRFDNEIVFIPFERLGGKSHMTFLARCFARHNNVSCDDILNDEHLYKSMIDWVCGEISSGLDI